LVDHSETGLSTYVLLSGATETLEEKLRVVEEIEKLSPELQIHALAEGQRKVFDH
jgi:hypothetical protein